VQGRRRRRGPVLTITASLPFDVNSFAPRRLGNVDADGFYPKPKGMGGANQALREQMDNTLAQVDRLVDNTSPPGQESGALVFFSTAASADAPKGKVAASKEQARRILVSARHSELKPGEVAFGMVISMYPVFKAVFDIAVSKGHVDRDTKFFDVFAYAEEYDIVLETLGIKCPIELYTRA
jgi:hypothetical protein